MAARDPRTRRWPSSRRSRLPSPRSSGFAILLSAFIGSSTSQASELAALFIGPPLPAAVSAPTVRPLPTRVFTSRRAARSRPGSRERASKAKTEARNVAPAAAPAKPERPRRQTEKQPQEARYRVEKNKVYLGREATFKRPAVIRAGEIYAAIPSYRKIAEKGLTRDDPEYWPLMRKTTVLFVRALRAVCGREGYDLVAEFGSVSTEAGDEIPEITRAVIASLSDGLRRNER